MIHQRPGHQQVERVVDETTRYLVDPGSAPRGPGTIMTISMNGPDAPVARAGGLIFWLTTFWVWSEMQIVL
jgi:hypothetical protein